MKTHLTSKNNSPLSGFTLIEMTVTIIVGLLIATMSLTLFNHQLSVYRIINTQNFLIHEAPQVNNSLNRVVSRANFFRLYPTLQDAESATNPTLVNAQVMALQFNGVGQNPNTFGVIAFEPTNNTLNYYHLESLAQLSSATPAWRISNQVDDVVFFIDNGVLRTRITGTNGAEIIHSTTTQR